VRPHAHDLVVAAGEQELAVRREAEHVARADAPAGFHDDFRLVPGAAVGLLLSAKG
jgi:hypothetical protein